MLADWRIEPLTGQVIAPDGSRRHVAPRAMEVLICLARRPGAAGDRKMLLGEAWGNLPHSHEALTHCVSELRHALDDRPDDPQFLQTLPRLGYRLVAEVTFDDGPAPGRAPAADDDAGFFVRHLRDLQQRKVFRTLIGYPVLAWLLLQIVDVLWEYFLAPLGAPAWLVPAFVVLLALGYPVAVFLSWAVDLTPEGMRAADEDAGFERYGGLLIVGIPTLAVTAIALFVYFNAYEVPATAATPPAPAQAARVAPMKGSVAVLRFLNLSRDADIGYLSDGLTEELIHELANLRTLKVAARTSVWLLGNGELAAPDIAERLNVEHVVEGSVRKDGDTVRVTAQLIDQDGFHRWSQTYDRPLNDILAVQKDIASRVAGELDVMLIGDTGERLDRAPTTNTLAYDHYLRGRHALRAPDSEATLSEAETQFEAAIELDRRFPLAHAGLCETWLARYRFERDATWFSRAESACHRALTLDGGLAEVYTALGNLYRHSGQNDKAELEYHAALAINPTLEEATYGLGRSYQAQGRLAEAEETLKRGIELEPSYWGTWFGVGNFLHRQARYADAVPYYRKVTELAPDYAGGFINLGSALHWLGDWDGAEAAWRRALELEEDAVAYQNMGTLYYYRHEFEQAEQMFERAVALAPNDHRHWGKLGAARRNLAGRVEDSQQSYRRAIELVRGQLDVDPDDAENLGLLADYLANVDELQAARSAIQRALQISPQNASAHYFAAVIERRDGNDARALAALREALRLGYSARMLAADPQFDALWNNGGFDAVMARELAWHTT